jgi:hypothetical protein
VAPLVSALSVELVRAGSRASEEQKRTSESDRLVYWLQGRRALVPTPSTNGRSTHTSTSVASTLTTDTLRDLVM